MKTDNQRSHCIIIGAGAAGLMAAMTLKENGYEVTVLEARKRVGGRIYTFTPENFSHPIDVGAEFVHGDLPLTKQLLDYAKIKIHELTGDMVRFEEGKKVTTDFFEDEWKRLLDELQTLEHDMPLAQFLDEHFPQNA